MKKRRHKHLQQQQQQQKRNTLLFRQSINNPKLFSWHFSHTHTHFTPPTFVYLFSPPKTKYYICTPVSKHQGGILKSIERKQPQTLKHFHWQMKCFYWTYNIPSVVLTQLSSTEKCQLIQECLANRLLLIHVISFCETRSIFKQFHQDISHHSIFFSVLIQFLSNIYDAVYLSAEKHMKCFRCFIVDCGNNRIKYIMAHSNIASEFISFVAVVTASVDSKHHFVRIIN